MTYDAKGRVSYETDVQKQGSDTYTSYVSNAFADGAGTAYALGAATSSSNTSYKNGAYQSTASTATSYAWYDAAVQAQVDYSPGTGGTYHTYYTNAATGVLKSASVNDGRPRSITLVNDALGQALRRDEADNNGATGDPHELWYRFNGRQIGYIGNNDTDNINYAASLQRRVTASAAGPFKNGQIYGAGIVDFDQAYDAINSYQQGAGGGSYTVRDGDTLSGIAAQLWGDAGLWYKLAQANGLAGDGGLVAGQTLTVPAGVVRSSNNAGTFRPYDVTQAYGDSSPTTPAPQAAKKNKCGAFGQILLVAIAVAVTIWASPASLASMSFLEGALAGAAGSAASQAVGLATGIQDKFDFKSLALSAISGGVTAGINGSSLVSGIKSAVVKGAVSGALASAVTQGIGVATGLQSKFDWAGVAGAGIGAGVGQALGGSFDKLGKFGGRLAANTAGGLVNAATRSLVNGTDFGDNLIAALPDIIGQTVGSWAADRIQDRPSNASTVLAGGAIAYDEGPITRINSNLIDQLDLSSLSPEYGGDIFIRATRGPVTDQIAKDRALNAAYLAGNQPYEAVGTAPETYGDPSSTWNGFAKETNRQWATGELASRNVLDKMIQIAGGFDGNMDAMANAFIYGNGSTRGDPTGQLAMMALLDKGAESTAYGKLYAELGRQQQAEYDREQIPGSNGIRDAGIALLKGQWEVAKNVTVVGGGIDLAIRKYNGEPLSLSDSLAALPLLAKMREISQVGAEGISLLKRGSTTAEAIAPKIHKNSLNYVGDTHVYVIKGPDGSLYKVGESAQGIRVGDGASIRAEQQARALQRETGDFYTTEIRQNFGGKADARTYETRFIQTYERLYGKRPPGNLFNR